MKLNYITTKQECPDCKSKDIFIEGINNFFCKQCGKSGLLQPMSKFTPRVACKGITEERKRFVDKANKFFTSTNPSFCPKCKRKMKKQDNFYKCKCGFFESADVIEG